MNSSWIISQENITKFETIFYKLEPTNNRLSGEKIKQILLKSELSNDILAKLWELSDIDKDGYLDKDEFILIMHLIKETIQGRIPSDPLPISVIPPSKRALSTSADPLLALLPPQVGGWQDSTRNTLSIIPKSVSPTYSIQSSGTESITEWPEWPITNEEQNAAYNSFCLIDTDADSLISGSEVKSYLNQSGLSNETLAKIWGLVDYDNSGKLNREQFALIIHLIQSQINKSFSLPNSLPPRLIPPSLRPCILDDKMRENSRMLLKEIEKINKQKNEIKQICTSLEHESINRIKDIELRQMQVNKIRETNDQLCRQKMAAEAYLKDYEVKISQLNTQISDYQEKIRIENSQLLQLKSDMENNQSNSKKLESEVDALRQELNEVTRQEAQIKKSVGENQSRRSLVEKEINTTNEFINKIYKDIEELQKSQKLLQEMEEKKINGNLLDSDWTQIKQTNTNITIRDLESFKKLSSPVDTNSFKPTPLEPFVPNNLDSFEQFPLKQNSIEIKDAFDPFPINDTKPKQSSVRTKFDPFAPTNDTVKTNNLDLFSAKETQSPVKESASLFDAFSFANTEKFDCHSKIHTDPFSPTENNNCHDLFSLEFSREPSKPISKTADDPFDMKSFSNTLQQNENESRRDSKTTDPPPRPPAISMNKIINSPNKIFSESDQIKWAQNESERLAKLASQTQQQEDADLALALKLSLEDK